MAALISEENGRQAHQPNEKKVKEETINALEAEKQRLSSRKMKLYSDYRTDRISREEYVKENNDAISRINAINQELCELKNGITAAEEEVHKKQSDEWGAIAKLETFDRALFGKVINRVIFLGNDQLEIEWKMDDPFH